MTPNMDDPRWTAYALGELADTDRAELDRLLESSSEARAYLASLREAISLIETELAAAPSPALDDLQRRRIQSAATTTTRSSRRRRWVAGSIAAAASALVVLGIGIVHNSTSDAELASGDRAEHEPAVGPGYFKYQAQLGVELPNGSYATDAALVMARNKNQLDSIDLVHNTEAYSKIDDNPFHRTKQDPLSTFSADVDTASYSNIRRFLSDGALPPKDAVRIEEMINYFAYSYPEPDRGEPFSITTEVGPAPWDTSHRLVRIGLKTPSIDDAQVPARNLVFLIDTSGSMQDANKLPLLKQSLGLVVDHLRPQDRVSLVVYAGAAGLVLPPTSDKETIRQALTRLEAGGSTNGGEGIQLAYDVAQKHLVKGGINRIILCSDGDMNVGITSEGDLSRLIEKERERGVFLTVLGFGMGNLKDSTMEKLADRGNGNYAYIDSLSEARKVLVKEAGATLVTVAKDVKLQVEFNPTTVAGYRLIGYENRVLANQDFNDDKKDAGDLGAGHTVTALYELVPAGVTVPSPDVDPLKYQSATTPAAVEGELMTIKARYKAPDSKTSKLLSRVVRSASVIGKLSATSIDYRWASAIAGFGMLLRESPFRGNLSWQQVQTQAEGALGLDPDGYRKQALYLIQKASRLPSTTP